MISTEVLFASGGCLFLEGCEMARLVFLDQGGLAELSDGTKWRIAYDYLPTTRLWLKGSEISVAAQPHGTMWPYTLTHQQTGESVSASPSPGVSPPSSQGSPSDHRSQNGQNGTPRLSS